MRKQAQHIWRQVGPHMLHASPPERGPAAYSNYWVVSLNGCHISSPGTKREVQEWFRKLTEALKRGKE